jgi:acid stress-induced BolA-like protein IbaG/YrbA
MEYPNRLLKVESVQVEGKKLHFKAHAPEQTQASEQTQMVYGKLWRLVKGGNVLISDETKAGWKADDIEISDNRIIISCDR